MESAEDAALARAARVTTAVLAVVLVVVGGVLIATSGDGGSSRRGGEATAAVLGTTDGFERAGALTLGPLTSDRDWLPVAGTWGIDDGDARVVRPVEARNHALVRLGAGDGAVQARIEHITNGAGVVFRFQDPFNYWAVVAAPSVGTWNLVRVENGESTVLGNTGPSAVADGTTVAARFDGDDIEVMVNGEVRLAAADGFLSDQGRVGLTVRGGDAAEARFDDVVVALARSLPLVIRGETPGATTPSSTPTSLAGDGN